MAELSIFVFAAALAVVAYSRIIERRLNSRRQQLLQEQIDAGLAAAANWKDVASKWESVAAEWKRAALKNEKTASDALQMLREKT